MGDDDIGDGSFRVGADRLPRRWQDRALDIEPFSSLPVTRESIRHAGMRAGDHQRVDGVVTVVGSGFLAVATQNVVQFPEFAKLGGDPPGDGLHRHRGVRPNVRPQTFQKRNGLPRGISRVVELAIGEAVGDGTRQKPLDFSERHSLAAAARRPHFLQAGFDGCPPVGVVSHILERRPVVLLQIFVLPAERLVSETVVQGPGPRPDVLYLELVFLEQGGKADMVAGVGAALFALLPEQPFFDVVA